MINTLKVKGRMVELGLKQSDLAREMNISLPTISQKINNKRPIHLNEAQVLARMLKIKEGDLGLYFFCDDVAKSNKSEQRRFSNVTSKN